MLRQVNEEGNIDHFRPTTETSRVANVREVDSMQPGSDLHGAAFLAGHRLVGATKLSDTCEAFCKDIAAEKIGVIESFIYFIRHVQKSPTKRAMLCLNGKNIVVGGKFRCSFNSLQGAKLVCR